MVMTQATLNQLRNPAPNPNLSIVSNKYPHSIPPNVFSVSRDTAIGRQSSHICEGESFLYKSSLVWVYEKEEESRQSGCIRLMGLNEAQISGGLSFVRMSVIFVEKLVSDWPYCYAA